MGRLEVCAKGRLAVIDVRHFGEFLGETWDGWVACSLKDDRGEQSPMRLR